MPSKELDAVQQMLRRARGLPFLCAFCGHAKDKNVDLIAVDDSGEQVQAQATVPLCNRCLASYLAFAGPNAVIIPGAKR